jgi:hypothetical protein
VTLQNNLRGTSWSVAPLESHNISKHIVVKIEYIRLVDMYVKVEYMRLDWYSLPKHQKIIRVELYYGIVDTLKTGVARASGVGRLIVLPRNFNGGERDVQGWFLDAMTLVQWFGKPDYFVTMTCNPYWEEVGKELFLGQTSQDRRSWLQGFIDPCSIIFMTA